jgi:hypothetical protein
MQAEEPGIMEFIMNGETGNMSCMLMLGSLALKLYWLIGFHLCVKFFYWNIELF